MGQGNPVEKDKYTEIWIEYKGIQDEEVLINRCEELLDSVTLS